MASVNLSTLRVVNGKDPLRYPKVQTKIENIAKGLFEVQSKLMIVDITKEMVNTLNK